MPSFFGVIHIVRAMVRLFGQQPRVMRLVPGIMLGLLLTVFALVLVAPGDTAYAQPVQPTKQQVEGMQMPGLKPSLLTG
jgi:hypothetical protein